MPILLGADVKAVRSQMDVYGLSGDMKLEFAFQESDDPENWPATTSFMIIGANNATADGVTAAGSAFDSITVSKAHIRLGVTAKNASNGSKNELAWVSTRFDTRAC